VLAISIESFGQVASDSNAPDPSHHAIEATGNNMHGVEMATFYIGQQLFALRAQSVLEALPASAVNPVSAGRLRYCRGTLARHSQGHVTGYVWVFDLAQLLTGKPTRMTDQSQVVVLEHDDRKLGVLVDALHGVNHFTHDNIIASPRMAGGAQSLVNELIKANQGSLLVQCLDPQGLLNALHYNPSQATSMTQTEKS